MSAAAFRMFFKELKWTLEDAIAHGHGLVLWIPDFVPKKGLEFIENGFISVSLGIFLNILMEVNLHSGTLFYFFFLILAFFLFLIEGID